LNVESKYGQGSTFSFFLFSALPDSQQEFTDPTSTNPEFPTETNEVNELARKFSPRTTIDSDSQDHHCSPTVLIVDDNAINREILSAFLKHKGLFFDVASGGREALSKISRRVQDYPNCVCGGYSMIILDYQMPDICGPKCAKKILSLFEAGKIPSLPVIIGHTAYSAKEDRDYFLSCGACDILEKPFTTGNFTMMIEKWLIP